MKKLFLLSIVVCFLLQSVTAQPSGCTFKPPFITIQFGTGNNVRDMNTTAVPDYVRFRSSCPYDGAYSYSSYTSDCFNGDWFTLPEDHTPGDADGNMMLVNAGDAGSVFFNTTVSGLKGSTTYELGAWLMNICRISDQCPFPLLPNITIRLKTVAGKTVAQFNTGELVRRTDPHWTQYRAVFTMPASETALIISMQDNAPSGCGNDFALDDITFRECVKTIPPVVVRKTAPPVITQKPPLSKGVVKKESPKPAPVENTARVNRIETKEKSSLQQTKPVSTQKPAVFAPPPPILVTRANPLVKQIETEAGELQINVYDNGEIDGDTVSIYHNNEAIVSNARLSQKPITFRITIDPAHPHHELIMVANNLGSIPPNTSLMLVTVNNKRYEVFISSSEQKNAKVVIDLKE